jgi:hypothetical protein
MYPEVPFDFQRAAKVKIIFTGITNQFNLLFFAFQMILDLMQFPP